MSLWFSELTHVQFNLVNLYSPTCNFQAQYLIDYNHRHRWGRQTGHTVPTWNFLKAWNSGKTWAYFCNIWAKIRQNLGKFQAFWKKLYFYLFGDHNLVGKCRVHFKSLPSPLGQKCVPPPPPPSKVNRYYTPLSLWLQFWYMFVN